MAKSWLVKYESTAQLSLRQNPESPQNSLILCCFAIHPCRGGVLCRNVGRRYLVRSPGFSRNLFATPASIPPEGGTTNQNQVPVRTRSDALTVCDGNRAILFKSGGSRIACLSDNLLYGKIMIRHCMSLSRIFSRSVIPGCLLLLIFVCSPGMAQESTKQAPAKRRSDRRRPALVKVEEKAGLPRVLLIGDSISMGYTLPVRELLKDKANVIRPLTNCGRQPACDIPLTIGLETVTGM